MRASAVARAVASAGGTRLEVLRSEPPLVLRETPGALYLVGGAAGPLGGDELDVRADVGPGATLCVRSAAATLAQPGPRGDASRLRTRLCVGEGGSLSWAPEPLVSVRGSRHVIDTQIELAEGASLSLVEEVVLGRFDEPSGRVTTRLRVNRGGQPLVAHDLDLGEAAIGWASSAVLGESKAVRTHLIVGQPALPASSQLTGDVRSASLPIAPDVTLVLTVCGHAGRPLARGVGR